MAPPIKGFNNYKTEGEITRIFLEDNNGIVYKECIIDTDDLQKLKDTGLSFHAAWDKASDTYYCEAIERTRLSNGKIKTKTIYMHRFILGIKDRKIRVDHYDHNPLNNRKTNLRISDASLNSRHRNRPNSNNKTGIRNICLIDNKWIIQLQVEGKNTRLASFDYEDLDKAIEKVKELRPIYYGDFCGE
jgi:hypothetical protein